MNFNNLHTGLYLTASCSNIRKSKIIPVYGKPMFNRYLIVSYINNMNKKFLGGK